MRNEFLSDESGAVTVDWVVLTAAVTGLALSVAALLASGLQGRSGDIGGTLADYEIPTVFVTATGLAANGPVSYDQAFIDSQLETYRGYDAAALQSTYAQYQSEYAMGGAYGTGAGYAVDELGMIEQAASDAGVTLDAGTGATYDSAYAAFTDG